jgi:aquaporin Z
MAVSLTGEPLAIGVMFMAMVYLVGPISGAHVNPAVSLAMFIRGRLAPVRLAGYAAAQVIGASLVSVLAYVAVGAAVPPKVIPSQALWFAGSVELLLSFVLVSLVLIVATTNKFKDSQLGGIILGLTLAGLATFIGTYNPAIALGAIIPSFILGTKATGTASPAINELVVYVIIPLIGGALSALHFNMAHRDQE